MRPLGAFLFGRLADDYGRRPVLMLDILLYSLFGFLIAFTPNLSVFLIARAAVRRGDGRHLGHRRLALALETIQPSARGFVSGLLQSGYPSGYLVASLVFGAVHAELRLARHVHGRADPGVAAGRSTSIRGAGIAGVAPPRSVNAGKHLLHLVGVAVILAAMLAVLIRSAAKKACSISWRRWCRW